MMSLRNILGPQTRRDGRETNYLADALEDLRNHLNEVKKSAVRIAGGINAEHPLDAIPGDWKGTPAKVRGCWQESIFPRRENRSLSNTLHIPDISLITWDHEVDIPPQILIEIFNNILDNAIKYDFSPPSVIIKFSLKKVQHGEMVLLSIRNLAPTVTETEAKSIRIGGYRSQFAKDRDVYGSGIGLKYNLEKCAQWGINLNYNIPTIGAEAPEHDPPRLGWHEVKLELPLVGKRNIGQ